MRSFWTGPPSDALKFWMCEMPFALLMFWRLPPWLVVAIAAAGGSIIAAVA